MCDMTHLCVTWLIYVWHDSSMCDMTHLCVTWLIYVWHDSSIRGMIASYIAWLIHRGHDSYIHMVTWLIHTHTHTHTHLFHVFSSHSIKSNDACMSLHMTSTHVLCFTCLYSTLLWSDSFIHTCFMFSPHISRDNSRISPKATWALVVCVTWRYFTSLWLNPFIDTHVSCFPLTFHVMNHTYLRKQHEHS